VPLSDDDHRRIASTSSGVTCSRVRTSLFLFRSVAGWAYEEGRRLLGLRVKRRRSRPAGEPTRWTQAGRFRDFAAAIAVPTFVLDGEVAIFDRQLRSRVELLRRSDPTSSPHRRSTSP
jgi:hypothetical protein